jgi:DNA processing protein
VTTTGGSVPDEVERAAWIAFSRVSGIGAQRTRRLLDRFGTLAAAWVAPASAYIGMGLDRRTIEALAEARLGQEGRRDLDQLHEMGAMALTWLDPEYPPALRAVSDSPPVLYVRGRVEALAPPAVAIVGTRRATGYGRDQAERFAADLVHAGWMVVSGLARGVDTYAHRGALAARTPPGSTGMATIAVLGHGIDTVYPPENRALAAQIAERGAVVADYPLGTGPAADHFPARNRIISGLALGTLLIEAPPGSGALITTTYANEQGRQVFAVPGQVTSPASEGCHRLIQAGARLAISADDIVMDLLPSLAVLGREGATAPLPRSRAPGPQLAFDIADDSGRASGRNPVDRGSPPALGDAPSDDQMGDEIATQIMGIVRAAGRPVHVDDIVRACGAPAPEVAGALMLLELDGILRADGTMTYAITGARRT